MNNLRVDLIDTDTERRSSSPVNMKMAARLGGTIAGVLVVSFVAFIVIRAGIAQKEVDSLKQQWEGKDGLEAKQTNVKKLQATLRQNKEIKQEISSWTAVRLPWDAYLESFAANVPASIQITTFKVSGPVVSEGKDQARRYTLEIKGKVVADDPEKEVSALKNNLSAGGGLSEPVDKTDMGKFEFTDVRSGTFPITVTHKSRKYSL